MLSKREANYTLTHILPVILESVPDTHPVEILAAVADRKKSEPSYAAKLAKAADDPRYDQEPELPSGIPLLESALIRHPWKLVTKGDCGAMHFPTKEAAEAMKSRIGGTVEYAPLGLPGIQTP